LAIVRFARLAGLASILAEMEPDAAVAILNAMDPSRAGAVLGHFPTAGGDVAAAMPAKVRRCSLTLSSPC